MSLPTTISVTKRDGKLVNTNLIDKVKFDTFFDGLKEGERIEVTYETIHNDATRAQMKKLRASIRAIAKETGETEAEMTLIIKKRCGFLMGNTEASFGDASKDELSRAIQECIIVGDIVNINLH